MITVSATVVEVPKLLTKEAARLWDEGLQTALDIMADVIRGKASKLAPVAFGRLRNSIVVERPQGRAEMTRFVTSPLPYAIVMEDGRKPGRRMPPASPLALWVRRVLKIDPSDPRFDSAVYLLRRKIARDGIQPRGFFKLAAQFGEDEAKDIFDHALGELARKLERRA